MTPPAWQPATWQSSWGRWLLVACLLAAGGRTLPRFLAAYGLHSEPGLERLEAAVRRAPDDPGHHFRLGVATRDLPQAMDLERSGRHLEKAIELNPRNWRYRRELALLHELAGRPSEAEKSYLEAVRLNTGSADYRWRLAHFYLRSGSLDKALPHFRTALEAEPRRRRSALASLLEAGAGRAQILAAWPASEEARAELPGLLCGEQTIGRYDAAESWCTGSSADGPPDPPRGDGVPRR